MAYANWTQRKAGGVRQQHHIARFQALHRPFESIESNEFFGLPAHRLCR